MLLLIVFHMTVTACVHSSSSGRLCLCIENQFSHQYKRQKKCKKTSVRKWNPCQPNCVSVHVPLDHCLTLL